MKPRTEVARKIEELMTVFTNEMFNLKECKHHFGWQELKVLMDFIYGGPPTEKSDELNTKARKENKS